MSFTGSTEGYETWLAGKLEDLGGLDTEALALKHEKMRGEFAHPFLRATFYRWAERWQDREKDAPVVLSVGDVHVENFGTWAGPNKELVWGINDADEACRLPWVSDVGRLAVSMRFALEETAITGVSQGAALVALLAGYAEGMSREAAPKGMTVTPDHTLHGLLKKHVLSKDPAKFWEKQEKKTVAAEKMPASASEVLQRAMPMGVPAGGFFMPDPEDPPGTGSLGKRRFYLRSVSEAPPVMMEVKPAVPSALVWATGGVATGATRELLECNYRIADPMQQLDAGWIVRGISPLARKLDFADLQKDGTSEKDWLALCNCMGSELAGVHRSGGDASLPAAVLDDLGKRGPEGVWLMTLVQQEEEALKEDKQNFKLGL
jgi:hypothetical protein